MTGAGLVRLYPRAWRARYETEFLAVLEACPAGRRDRIDIARGAIDAHLHPPERSLVPGLAALIGGGAWILAAAPLAGLPVPPDWPGYLLESLPAALVAVVFLAVALGGAWLREDGRGGRLGRRLAAAGVTVGVSAQLAWAMALAWTLIGWGYGAPLAIASTLAGLGSILVGLALARIGDWPIAGLLVLAPVLLLIPGWAVPSAATWLGFGAAWVAVGLAELFGSTPTAGRIHRPT